MKCLNNNTVLQSCMSYDWMMMCIIKERKIYFNGHEMYFMCLFLIFWIQGSSQHVLQLSISIHAMKSQSFIYFRCTLCFSSFPKSLISYTKSRVYRVNMRSKFNINLCIKKAILKNSLHSYTTAARTLRLISCQCWTQKFEKLHLSLPYVF